MQTCLKLLQQIHLTVLDMQFHNGCAVSPAGLNLRCFAFYCKNVHWSKNTNMHCFWKQIHKQTILENTWKTQKKQPWGSKPPSRQMFQILLQECTLINNNRHVLFFWKKKHENTQNTWNIIETYFKKKPVAWKHPPAFFCSYSWCVIIACYSCSSKSKYWQMSGKQPEKTPTKPSRLETTLPALFLVPIHDLLSLHFYFCSSKNKYWKIPEIPKKCPKTKTV